MDDAFALSMACKQTLSSLLSLLASFSKEDEYTLLSQIITVCSSLSLSLSDDFLFNLFDYIIYVLLSAKQISYKIANIAADAAQELLAELKQFLITLLWRPAEYTFLHFFCYFILQLL